MRIYSIIALFVPFLTMGQNSLEGKIFDASSMERIENAKFLMKGSNIINVSNKSGMYLLESIPEGTCTLIVSCIGYKSDTIDFKIKPGSNRKNIKLEQSITMLRALDIGDGANDFNLINLRGVDGAGIYEGKKSDIIKLDRVAGNKSTNNAREIYNQVAGLNIWESDGGGIQLGIGGRGLSPDRSSNFNVRQNGYDISADALGYPESYYTPPVEAMDRIEIVRGAASLQYGTQFGGVVNFKLKQPFQDKKLGLLTRNTIGSNGLYTNFTQLGGRKGLSAYSGYINYKKGDDFRPNSEFEQYNVFASYRRHLSENTTIGLELTKMYYLAHQPGGLTDQEFEADPYMSDRERNWFKVDWNLGAVKLRSKLSKTALLDAQVFGLLAERQSLGFLGRADRVDPETERTLIDGSFKNIGTEVKLLKWYGTDTLPHIFLSGIRAYSGRSSSRQGSGDDGFDANFDYLNADSLDSDYLFPSYNLSAFSENIFNLTERFSVTPGLRLEHIVTKAQGYYVTTFKDLAGNIIEQNVFNEDVDRSRTFVIGGIGLSYDVSDDLELYANGSQNYRAITFNDIRITNPNFRIDPNITDENGYSADFGFRGHIRDVLAFDVSLFYLYYNDRIGLISQNDDVLNSVYMLRTNVADSRNYGVESFARLNLTKIFNDSLKWDLTAFANTAFIAAEYISNANPTIDGNRVELAPEFTFKTGLGLTHEHFGASWQFSYSGEQFTDASNSVFTSSAVNGLVPAYSIQDASMFIHVKRYRLEMGVNNVLDEVYFTRRASGYPGPGILPSAGRTWYATLQITI